MERVLRLLDDIDAGMFVLRMVWMRHLALRLSIAAALSLLAGWCLLAVLPAAAG